MKGFKTFAFIMLVLTLLSSSAVFANVNYFNKDPLTSFVNVDHIEVNSQVVNDFSPVYLEREQQVQVAVYFTGNPNGVCTSGNNNVCYNTRVSAELDGYEYGDVRDITPNFEVEKGVQYRKVLSFKLPADIQSSMDLTLRVEIKDENDLVVASYPIRLQEIRHKLNIYDVIFNPTSNVQAGQPLFTNVRLENLGDNVESSIKVTVAIPALGLQTSQYVDRLTTLQATNNDVDTNDAATTNDLLLMIPQNVLEGDYSVVVTADYNREASSVQKTYTMHVKGTQVVIQNPVVNQVATTVNVDSQVQKVEQGNGATFKFSVGNLGQQATAYTFTVVGADAWANTRVDPSTVVVQANSASDAYVYVAPKPDTTGLKTFTVKVMSNNVVVAEKNLSVEVSEAKKGLDLKTVFTWVFAVLLVILVLLVIVVLVKRFASKENKGIEGQTYY